MKTFTLFLLLAMATANGMASTIDMHTFIFRGSETEDHFLLKTIQTTATPETAPDHQVVANFNIKILSKPKEPTDPTSCSILFKMEGEKLQVHSDCRNYLVISGFTKTITIAQDETIIQDYSVSLEML